MDSKIPTMQIQYSTYNQPSLFVVLFIFWGQKEVFHTMLPALEEQTYQRRRWPTMSWPAGEERRPGRQDQEGWGGRDMFRNRKKEQTLNQLRVKIRFNKLTYTMSWFLLVQTNHRSKTMRGWPAQQGEADYIFISSSFSASSHAGSTCNSIPAINLNLSCMMQCGVVW